MIYQNQLPKSIDTGLNDFHLCGNCKHTCNNESGYRFCSLFDMELEVYTPVDQVDQKCFVYLVYRPRICLNTYSPSDGGD